MDMSVSALVLIFFIPIGLLIAGSIYLFDPGPIFYRQERVGQGGKKFRLWKFRTMKVHQPSGSGHITYGTQDPRITPLGYYLRMLKLDEVPQLINVIKGEMSLVGPRPEVEKYVSMYNTQQKKILDLRPGCTDITVLYGHFHDAALLENHKEDAESFYINVLMPKKIEHNLFYLANQSLWLDLKILVGTVLLMLRIRENKPMTAGLSVIGGLVVPFSN
ncbi:MAG: sugar transferase [Nitrospirales bacterium]|nr:sugar transferase [Nitrospirales bacterium]